MTWRDRAACKDADPNLFFPSNSGIGIRQVAEAKAICEPCPVRQTCLDENLTASYGVFGGMTSAERTAERMRRFPEGRPPRHGSRACYYQGCREPECVQANRNHKNRHHRGKAGESGRHHIPKVTLHLP